LEKINKRKAKTSATTSAKKQINKELFSRQGNTKFKYKSHSRSVKKMLILPHFLAANVWEKRLSLPGGSKTQKE
jgi:hypothetical protein